MNNSLIFDMLDRLYCAANTSPEIERIDTLILLLRHLYRHALTPSKDTMTEYYDLTTGVQRHDYDKRTLNING